MYYVYYVETLLSILHKHQFYFQILVKKKFIKKSPVLTSRNMKKKIDEQGTEKSPRKKSPRFPHR
jgi:hypothetical protein